MRARANGPGLMLFVDGHYSWVYITGTEPRLLRRQLAPDR